MKKIITLLITFIFFTSAGFGCKGLSQEQKAAIRPVTLNYWTVYNDMDVLKEFAQQYQLLRPYVTVKIRQVGYEEFDRLFTNALADDVAPDIVSMHIHWLKKNQNRLLPAPPAVQMARMVTTNEFTKEQQVVVDTMPLPSIQMIKNSYVSTVYDDVILENQIFGYPLAVDAMAVFYNRDLLDRAGIAEVPQDWEAFVEAVKAITKFNATGDIVQSGAALGTAENIDAVFDLVSLFMMQSGVEMSQKDRVAFIDGLKEGDRNHPVMRALDFYTDFARPIKEVYSWNEKKESAFDEFVRGRLAFYFGYAYNFPRIQAWAPQMNIEVAPMFQLDPNNPANVANYWVESVVKKTKHPNEAWDFVRFITAPENLAIYTEKTFRPSPLRSQIAEQQKDEKMAPFATQALFAENWYHGSDIGVATDAFKTMITQLLEPYGSKNELGRDKTIISNTAARVQQSW